MPDAPAILASGRAPLTYGRLWRHVDEVVQTLRAMGISRQDRVALMLPNGAEMAVAILDEAGDVLPVGATGEVVVRGASIMQSYDDAAANQNTFTQGWFRTGDQGYMDADGYLFITGRIKEAINRGGEKITPQEVDDVLLGHPAVAQAVPFAMPHARLGEEVAAAVVLHPHALATDSDIRQFAAARLAAFKVPQRIVIVDNLPTGPAGKLQRLGLAERLGLTTEQHRLLVEWNASRLDYPHAQCLHQLFEAQAARTPDAIAVLYEDACLTYRALNRRANQVVHYLQTLGVGAEALVGLCKSDA